MKVRNIEIRRYEFYLTIATESELFLVRPGNGDTLVHSPIGVNATLHCVVYSSELEWSINGSNFASSLGGRQLHLRQIFPGPTMSLEGITTSSVIIFGDIKNNGTMICCQVLLGEDLIKPCTVLIIYGMHNKYTLLKHCQSLCIHSKGCTGVLTGCI